LRFTGSIQNRSLEPNTIEKVYLVVWRTKRKRYTHRMGFGGNSVLDKDNNPIGPPVALNGRQSIPVTVVCEFPVKGTADERLFGRMTPLSTIPFLAMPSFLNDYELAFEDVSGNLFDQNGLPRSMKSINLRWTLDNSIDRFKDGQPMALARHVGAMTFEEIRFTVKRMLRFVGL